MDFLHTLLAAVATYVALASVLGLIAKLYLTVRFENLDSPEGYSAPDVLFALIVPTLIALTWVVSGGTHMFQTFGQGLLNQTQNASHLFIALGLAYGAYRTLQEFAAANIGFPGRQNLPRESATAKRLECICRGHPVLTEHADRIHPVSAIDAPCVTRGLFRSEILVHCQFIDSLSQGELTAALLHEVAHAEARDPLHKWLGTIAIKLNPVGFLLQPDLARWLWACELTCDWRALSYGAKRTELAAAVVSAARGTEPCHHDHEVFIHGNDPRRVESRVQLLLANFEGVDSEPRQKAWPYYLGLSGAAVLVAGYLPHLIDAALLPMHCLVELGQSLV